MTKKTTKAKTAKATEVTEATKEEVAPVDDNGFIYIFTNPSMLARWNRVIGSKTPVNLTSETVRDPHLPLAFKPFAALKTAHYSTAFPEFIEALKNLTECKEPLNPEFFNCATFVAYNELKKVAAKYGEEDGIYCADPNSVKPRQEFKLRHPHLPPEDGSIEIYVGNLSYAVTMVNLKELFSQYGQVVEARVVTNPYNGRSKGFGFVHMPSREEAERAIAALNGKEYMGRDVVCNEAKNVISVNQMGSSENA